MAFYLFRRCRFNWRIGAIDSVSHFYLSPIRSRSGIHFRPHGVAGRLLKMEKGNYRPVSYLDLAPEESRLGDFCASLGGMSTNFQTPRSGPNIFERKVAI